MYAPSSFGANAYARIGTDTGVVGASPQRLTIMMFEASRTAIAQARLHLRAGRLAEKGVAIAKAVRIIGGGLKEGLDTDNGGDLAARLVGHYDSMLQQLTEANLGNDETRLANVDQMLAVLENAWRTAVPPQAPVAQATAGHRPVGYTA
ncbi:flagellar export chaperone FliS [Chitinasiproducens palmae]|uniref:Flagellar secretion chaperone FliS n=1 Tax=Chitinasiproducens palmae TaxID=1770053 RepID=A0A1H2PKT5_9BURK|nr:flagellar export chaperone FliS [Chitinasiproducens palmae]SDV46576.1 flagellar protein FliS [Chitinasiproducens palmae]